MYAKKELFYVIYERAVLLTIHGLKLWHFFKVKVYIDARNLCTIHVSQNSIISKNIEMKFDMENLIS